jgi:cytidylate kinase
MHSALHQVINMSEQSPKALVIAIDGPAASGKGTVAKRLARHLGVAYLDTGSIYRAIGYSILSEGHDPNDKKTAIQATKDLTPGDLINEHLYDEGVGAAASIISAIPRVRELLLQFQRDFARQPSGAILDGRDIGTVICPDADFKFYITANIEARAMRRFKQLQSKGNPVIYEAVLQDLQKRDERDSTREIAPLKPAHDAICIDTTDMNEDEVFAAILSKVESRD